VEHTLELLSDQYLEAFESVSQMVEAVNAEIDWLTVDFDENKDNLVIKFGEAASQESANAFLARMDYFFFIHGFYLNETIIVGGTKVFPGNGSSISVVSLKDYQDSEID